MIKDYHKQILVQPEHLDTNNHVNNIQYVQWMQDVAIEHSQAAYDLLAFLEQDNGMWVVRSHEIEYLRSAWLGDTIVIHTWVSVMDKFRSHREYTFTHQESGKCVARAKTLWIYLDRTSLRPKAIPPAMIRAYGLEAADTAENSR